MLLVMLKKKLLITLSLAAVGCSMVLLYISQQTPQVGEVVIGNQLSQGTRLGEVDLSYLTVPEAVSKLQEYAHKTTLVAFPHRAQRFSYADLGVGFNYQVLEDYRQQCTKTWFGCEEQAYPVPLANRIISINETEFKEFVSLMNTQVTSLLSANDVSFEDLTFRAHDPNGQIVVDEVKLRQQLNSQKIFSQKIIAVETMLNQVRDLSAQEEATVSLVAAVTTTPLLIKYGRQPVSLASETLTTFIDLVPRSGFTTAQINTLAIKDYLATLAKRYPLAIELEEKQAVLSIARALLYRAGGESPATVVILPLKGEPTTDGSYAPKYLELIKSQQRMYAFENGALVDTYIVGTGLTWETPSGNFQIMRKPGMSISYTGGWFMPYYMPIGTINGYFFGLHEIPYRLNAYGNITSRDVNTMGSPATGGCIQLYREDAIHLFEWADVGMPVLIRE